MNTTAIVLSLILACGSHRQVSDTTLKFRIAVPESAGSGPAVLVLHDVSVPSNRPMILRAYAVAPDSTRILLGASGLPAVAPDATGLSTHAALRMSVTSGLQRWAAAAKGASQMDVEISAEPPDTAAGRLVWSVKRVELLPSGGGE
jgi:hypothetical protein